MEPRPKGGIVLRECDAEQMASILGDIAIRGENLAEKRRLVLRRLAEELVADAWYWARTTFADDGRLQLDALIKNSGFSECEIERHFDPAGDLEDVICVDPDEISETASGRGVLKEAWIPRSGFNAEPQGAGYLLSVHQCQGAQPSCVVFFRREGRPRFSLRELKIAEGLLKAVPWLHASEDRATPEKGNGLPPRLNEVLQFLLEGLPRKEVADRMGISLHTVHGYARDLYSRFGVHSQAELICRLSSRRDAA